LDFVDNRAAIAAELKHGVQYEQGRITRDNLAGVLAARVEPGDLIIDLAWNIGCVDLLQWCHDNGVLYINTSVELWDPYTDAANQAPTDRTLYVRHMAIRDRMACWMEEGPTAVLEHGANPGLVSHFVKAALEDITDAILRHDPASPRRPELEQFLA